MLACLLALASFLFVYTAQDPYVGNAAARTWSSCISKQSRQFPQRQVTGQRDLANSPLRFSSQVTVGWIKLSAKTNWHTKRLESSTNE